MAALVCASPSKVGGQLLAHRASTDNGDAPTPAIALGGYCIVTLRDRQQWQPGDAALAVSFDGQQYRFVGQRERDVFLAAPADYAPILGGDCPVALAGEGKRVRGQLEYGVLHGGSRLVFFASDENRHIFLDEPKRFTDVDVALDGRCAVSRRHDGREVAGIPETAIVHRGLRWMFAGTHERNLFLRSPGYYDGSGGQSNAGPLEVPAGKDGEMGDRRQTAGQPLWRSEERPKSEPAPARSDGRQDIVLSAVPVMAGYCPVTLQREGAWVRGRYEHRQELDGLLFLTAGPNERDSLARDPASFVPALGGDCVVSYLTHNERVRGSVYHGYMYEGRLFLFADAERKAAFQASPARYAAADLAADGLCAVTRVDERRDAAGLREHAAWHAGKLYRFAGPAEKQKFLADPKRYEQ